MSPKIRLYVTQNLSAGMSLILDKAQSHYLANVMRCRAGDSIGVFNGSEGEWLAEVAGVEQRLIVLKVIRQLAPHKPSPDVWAAFAPVKNKVDIMVEKAVELGASAVFPVFTRHTVVPTVNHEKLIAYAIGAAAQSGRHDLPRIEEFRDLASLIAAWPKDRILLYGDESGKGPDIKALLPQLPPGKYGVLVGPEGGFSPEEHQRLKASPVAKPFCMGPRILRADTALIAALTCVQMWLGDWNEKPHFTA